MNKELTLYWNASPGIFVNKNTGEPAYDSGLGPQFNGTAREWYETLVETVYDMRNQLQRSIKAELHEVDVYVGGDAAVILECTVLFRPAAEKADEM